MRRIAIALFIWCAATALSLTSAIAQAPFQTFKDTGAGLGFRYPNGWQSLDPLVPGVFLYLVSSDGRSDCMFWVESDYEGAIPDVISEKKLNEIGAKIGEFFQRAVENYKIERMDHRLVGSTHLITMNFNGDVRVPSGAYPSAGRAYFMFELPRAVCVACMGPKSSQREMLQAFDLIAGSMILLPLQTASPPPPSASPWLGTWRGDLVDSAAKPRSSIELKVTSIGGTDVMGNATLWGHCEAKLPFFRGPTESGNLVVREEFGPCGLTTLILQRDGEAMRGTYSNVAGSGTVVLTKR